MKTFALTADERRALLSLARQAIHAHLTHGPAPPPPAGITIEGFGAFVSLHVGGDLRGCIGYPQSDRPLAEVIARCAVAAASEDPRFPPVTLTELAAAHVEISVLGPIQLVRSIEDIEVGRHGLIVSQGYGKGLLLPQVATEYGWDRETFLEHTCLKAGLPRDAWRSGAEIQQFEAEVFSEEGVAGG
jgi:AmmeMemoRadiSam system protein A